MSINNENETNYKRPWFKCCSKGNRVSVVGDALSIKIGGNNDDKKNKNLKKCNRIKSTKYSLITFLPQNLLEQFRRIANFYFLCMTVVAVLIDSPVSPLTSLIPLVFVIAVTAAKQGYEDFLRYRADNMVNLSLVSVIRNGEDMEIKCEDIRPGDLVNISRDCDVPCDLVVLKSAEKSGKCHITTANLDGETNLKTLTVPKGLPDMTAYRLHTLGHIECEYPRTDLYTFNGRIELSPSFNRPLSTNFDTQPENSNMLPLMAENLLLRGSRVKNTEWAIGCAVYTGQNTKLAMNSRITRNKMTSSEKFINKYLVFFLVLLIGIVTVCYFLKRFFDLFRSEHNFYLGEPKDTFQVSQFLQDYFSFLILFNYLIPISLYVTIEMHKFLGSFFLEWDPDLYDEETDQPCIVNTSDLNEELGQISILFSDKTGTLTKNIMIFQQCSINGKMYHQIGRGLKEPNRSYALKISECSNHVYNFFEALAVCHTVQVNGNYNKDEDKEDDSSTETNSPVVAKLFSDISNMNERRMSDQDETDFITMNVSRKRSATTANPLIDKSQFQDKLPIGNFQKPLLLNQLEVEQSHPNNPDLHNKMSSQLENTVNSSKNSNNFSNISTAQRPASDKFPKSSFFNADNRVHPRPLSCNFENIVAPTVQMTSTLSLSSSSKVQYELDFQYRETPPRVMSMDFKRTISEIQEKTETKTHRRTQSDALGKMRVSFQPFSQPTTPSLSRKRTTASRSSTREYYAAPAYTGQALIERMESIMHTREVDEFLVNLDYQASSPDEKALVEACAKLGFVYTGDENDILNISLKKRNVLKKFRDQNEKNQDEHVMQYKRLQVLEFTSDRKRMSMIVRNQNDEIWLYTKGAESHVLPLCTKTSSHMTNTTQKHINEFAKQGLRTLAVARRKLTQTEFSNFNNEFLRANNSITDRVNKVEECQRKIETGLELLGATAVEDALQDNVRDTLESLGAAGIKIWVLTGDKVETALNIALSCGHIPDNAAKYFITECTTKEQLDGHLTVLQNEMKRNPNQVFALLIDGASLALAIKHMGEKFRDISIDCKAVLCCRLSPLQKCEVVQLMKTSRGKPITAAIGDGANDVSMIQEAHVGLGIVGKEGRQAARCADYAFAKFCMAKKILLVHGNYFSQRLALLVLYFFYKNLVFMGIQLYFQMHSAFSSQSIYDSLFLTLYNVLYTALPVLFISLTEKSHSEEKLLKQPHLYQENAGNKAFSWKYFNGWMLLGTYHSVIIYIFGFYVWHNNNQFFADPTTANFACYGTFMIHNVVVLVNLKLLMEAVYRSWWFIATIWLSIFGFIGTTFIFNLFDVRYDGDLLNVYSNLLSSLSFWLLATIVLIAALLPDYTMRVLKILHIHVPSIYPGDRLKRKKQKVFVHSADVAESTNL